MGSFIENVFAVNLPLALSASLMVQTPDDLVLSFPLFKAHEPDADHTFLPVDLVDTRDEVA
jgi:hypothetical protein